MNKAPYTTVLCYGDSNTYGYDPEDGLRYAESVRWPGRLQALLGEKYKVIEEGCNGRTLCMSPEDEPWKNGLTTIQAILNSHKPLDWVVVMLGSNDLKAEFHPDWEEMVTGLGRLLGCIQKLLEEKQGYMARVLVVAPPAITQEVCQGPFAGSFGDEGIEMSRQFPEIFGHFVAELRKMGLTTYYFLNAQKAAAPSALDGLHLTREAHAALAEAVAAAISGATK